MRKRRAEMDQEDRGLNWDEKARKTEELLRDDPLWQKLKARVDSGPVELPGRGLRPKA